MTVKVNKTKTAQSAKQNTTDTKAKTDNKKSKEKTKSAPKKKKPFAERVAYAATLVLKQNKTDEQIIEAVNEKYSDYPGQKYNQKEMGRTRWMLRNDKIATVKHENKPFDRMFKVDGKLYTREDKPKKARAPKVTPENDPLKKVAGVNTHGKKSKQKAGKIKKQKA